MAQVVGQGEETMERAAKLQKISGLEGVGATLLPRQAKKKIASAAEQNRDPVGALSAAAFAQVVQSVKGSLPQVASGIRCWGEFCDPIGVTPHFPAQAKIVRLYLTIFRDEGTA